MSSTPPGPNWPLRLILFGCVALFLLTWALTRDVEVCGLVLAGAGNIAFCLFLASIFFYSVRLRLMEFVAVIAILGNANGIAAQQIFSRSTSTDAIAGFIMISMAITLVVSGGSAWGVWAARRFGMESTLQRVLMIVAGIVFLVAVLGMTFGGVALMDEGNKNYLTPIAAVFLGSLALSMVFARVHHRASLIHPPERK